VAWLRSTQDCLLERILSPGADTLARLSGPETARVRVVADTGSARLVLLDPDVDATALRTGGSVTTTVSTTSGEDGRRAAADSGPPPSQAD
jgi:hypothetical protein